MCTSQFMLSVSSTSVCDWECVLSSRWALSLLHLTNTNESPFLTRIDCLAHVHAFNTHFIELLSCSFYFTWTFHFNETKKPLYTASLPLPLHIFGALLAVRCWRSQHSKLCVGVFQYSKLIFILLHLPFFMVSTVLRCALFFSLTAKNNPWKMNWPKWTNAKQFNVLICI